VAKRKIDAAMLLAAGEEAHLQIKKDVSQAKLIDNEQFLEIDINTIEENPMQPRIFIDDEELNNLARSIKLHGLIQPISVLKLDTNKYILKAGQRRLLAHKQLGLDKIKAIVEEKGIASDSVNNKLLFEIAVLENTQREKLNPLEFALSIQKALDNKIYKNLDELSLVLSKSKSYISKVLKVLQLDKKIIEDLAKNKSTNDVETLYEIQKIKDKNKQIEVYFDFINKKIDRKGIRALNQKKTDLKKEPYTFNATKKSIKLSIDISRFDENMKNEIQNEINNIIKKYLL